MNSRMGGYSIYDIKLVYQAENVLLNFYTVSLQINTITNEPFIKLIHLNNNINEHQQR